MICPECGAEYMPGFTSCSDCLVDLVDALPKPETEAPAAPSTQAPQPPEPRSDPPERFSLVTVLATPDPGLMAVAKSLLQSAQIPFLVEGEAIQDLFGIGRLSGYNPITGPAALRVAPQDAADAQALLAELRADADVAEADDVAHS